jgi:hypothetical protein
MGRQLAKLATNFQQLRRTWHGRDKLAETGERLRWAFWGYRLLVRDPSKVTSCHRIYLS